MTTRHYLTAFGFVASLLAGTAHADGEEKQLERLAKQLEDLQTRVAVLEQRTTFTSFMPNFAERFHVMHRAGEAGDWAMASHELKEMKRLAALSTSVDAENGRLMRSMMAPKFDALEHAIAHGDGQKFMNTLADTIETCNACHVAAGSDFVEVTLEIPDLLSLRHPHRLRARSVPAGHTHDMPTRMDDTKHDSGESAHGHGEHDGEMHHN